MQRTIHNIIYNQRFWWRVQFSELSELYVSMSFKSLALSLVAVFVPVYLFQLGYSVMDIALFYAGYFAFRVPMNYLAGYFTSWYGPKHAISLSYIAFLVSLGLLLTLESHNWPLLVVEVSLAVYNSLFFIGYHVDFSQVEDNNHAGKQISTMSIFIRAAATLGPFIGGLVAGRWGFRATLGLAVLLLAVAAWPLLRTREQTHTRKQLRLARFDFRRDWRNNLVYVGEAISRQGTLVFWPLYLSVFVFVTNTYGMIGFVSTVSIGASLLTMRYFGKLVDDNKGGLLLAGSSVATAVTNSMRIFATNFGSVVFLNLSTELAESGQMLGMSRGFYGEADESNDRVGYVTTVEIVICLARSFQWLAMFFLVVLVGAKLAFALMFVTAGLGSLLINLQRFKSLKSHPFGIKLGQSE